MTMTCGSAMPTSECEVGEDAGAALGNTEAIDKPLHSASREIIFVCVAADEIRGAPPVCQDRAGCFVIGPKRDPCWRRHGRSRDSPISRKPGQKSLKVVAQDQGKTPILLRLEVAARHGTVQLGSRKFGDDGRLRDSERDRGKGGGGKICHQSTPHVSQQHAGMRRDIQIEAI
jgi:hypothetical protein